MSPTQIKFLAFRVYRFKDNKAYDDLMVYFGPKITRFLVFKLPHPEDADEVRSEVFLRAWEYMLTSEVKEAGGLFYKIARNLVADFYRKYQPTTELTDSSPSVAQSESLADNIAHRLEVDRLRKYIQKLPHEQAEILGMRFFDEMSVAEIAATIDKTPNHIRVLIHRARQALKDYVKF
jgi:RNA polymerase sigma-70 factor, ECF subfamily